ncbi:MAG TPA: MIP/aquaporin family protein [Rhizomicrobium sp.]|nr:MIP/aquaporin family protein [Rhizomicrobium sp.]
MNLPRRLAAEALGTALLLMAVVGSGIMGARLAGGNDAIALLANTLATGAALIVLISIFGPISGAHFNPAVTLVFAVRGEISILDAFAYAAVQFAASVPGVYAAHLMFALPVFEISTKLREGPAQAFSEFVATFGLVATVLGAGRHAPSRTPLLVGLYIAAAYWFTASTSFANPAVTVARALSDTFAGIAPGSVAPFVAAQILGALCGAFTLRWLLAGERVRAN